MTLTLCVFSFLSITASACQLSIVYANAWMPISSGDGEQVEGILPALTEALLGDRLGCQVTHLGVPWGRAQVMIKNGKADVFVTTPTLERLAYSRATSAAFYNLNFISFTRRQSPVHVAINNGVDITELGRQYQVCDVLGNNWARSFYSQHQVEYIETPAIENCLQMIQRGRADLVIHAADVAQHKIDQLGLSQLIVAVPKVFQQVSFSLLVSNRSTLPATFLDEVDTLLIEMKRSGEYHQLLEQLTRSVQ